MKTILTLLIFLFLANTSFADVSKDGKYIAYTLQLPNQNNSQIYVFDIEASAALESTIVNEKISRGQGSYKNPAWSPKGDAIAFEKIEGGIYFIGVMDADGQNERMIASDNELNLENPFWSQDGSKIFFNKTVDGDIWLMRVDYSGHNLEAYIM